MPWRRYIISLVVLAALAAGAWYGWKLWNAPPEDAGGGMQGGFAVPVDAAKTRKDTVLRTVEAVGTLASNESATLRAEEPGAIVEITFTEGERVLEGTLLMRLDDVLRQAELQQAQASLALSEANYERAAALAQRGSGTQRARDEALSALRFDQAAVALAEQRVKKTLITAPFTGVLGLRSVSIGDYVAVGEALVTLSAIDVLKIDFRIPELFLTEIKLGQELRIRVDAVPGQDFTGTVYAIDPQVDINGRALVIRATLPNDGNRLRPGLFARVDVILERRENALLIPEAALMPTKDGQFVFKVTDGAAEMVPVKTGLRQEGEVEIVEGLAEGDIVVTGGQLKLQTGVPVGLPPELAPPAPAPTPAPAPAQGGSGG